MEKTESKLRDTITALEEIERLVREIRQDKDAELRQILANRAVMSEIEKKADTGE